MTVSVDTSPVSVHRTGKPPPRLTLRKPEQEPSNPTDTSTFPPQPLMLEGENSCFLNCFQKKSPFSTLKTSVNVGRSYFATLGAELHDPAQHTCGDLWLLLVHQLESPVFLLFVGSCVACEMFFFSHQTLSSCRDADMFGARSSAGSCSGTRLLELRPVLLYSFLPSASRPEAPVLALASSASASASRRRKSLVSPSRVTFTLTLTPSNI